MQIIFTFPIELTCYTVKNKRSIFCF